MRLLLTAFEPFDESGLNASEVACRIALERLQELSCCDLIVLPVEYGADTRRMESAVAEAPPDLLLHTGQAAGARELRVERIAVNARYAGARTRTPHAQQRIEPDGPLALESPLPVDALASRVREAGVPCVVSNHAGIYLCNHVLYQSLRRGRRAGFVHVPCVPEQVGDGRPSLPGEVTARGLETLVRALLEGDSPPAATR